MQRDANFEEKAPLNKTVASDASIPSESILRFGLMLGIFLQMFGAFYCRDIPQALQTKLMQQMSLNSKEYNMLYSIIAFPGIITALVFGGLLNTIGRSRLNTISAVCYVLGQFIILIGSFYKSYILMLIGRFFLGIGFNQHTLQTIFIADIFHGENASFYMGFHITFAKSGNIANSLLTPLLYKFGGNSIFLPNAVGFALVLLVLVGTYLANHCDEQHELHYRKQASNALTAHGERQSTGFLPDCKSIGQFGTVVWLMIVIGTVLYGVYFTFTNIGSNFIEEFYKFSYGESNTVMASIYFFPAIITPFFGYLIELCGQRQVFLIISSLLGITFCLMALLIRPAPHLIFVFTPIGFFMSFYCLLAANVWVAIQLATSADVRGMSLGFFHSLMNLFMFVFPIVIAWIKDTNLYEGYAGVVAFFLICFCFTLLLAMFLQVWLCNTDHPIKWTSEEIRAYKDKLPKTIIPEDVVG